MARLAYQIDEAARSGRKFTNGTVGSLKRIDADGNFLLEKIPYWAFGSSNVSLDVIQYETLSGTKTLREIMETFNERDEHGEFFLPNSLGVSVMIQLADGTIISQKRNNAAVLTQYSGLTSSASGAVHITEHTGGTEILQANAVAEVTEELGLYPERIGNFPHITTLSGSIQERLLQELDLDGIS